MNASNADKHPLHTPLVTRFNRHSSWQELPESFCSLPQRRRSCTSRHLPWAATTNKPLQRLMFIPDYQASCQQAVAALHAQASGAFTA
jgi:hypothetical protein